MTLKSTERETLSEISALTDKLQPNYHSNAVKRIQLYKLGDTWVFDDKHLDLIAEPFILNASETIQHIIESIPGLTNKETPKIIFGEKLPKFHTKIYLVEDTENSGWYELKTETGTMKFWLCGVLGRFFNPIPKEIYLLFEN